MSPSPEFRASKRSILRDIALQVPFLIWLIVLWMLLWQQFTALAFVTGLAVALFVTRVFRLPTVELVGRVNLLYGLLFLVEFLVAVIVGAIRVTIQVFDLRRQPGAAIVEIPLRYADDILMTHVAITSSLIPGSLVVEADRDRHVLYLHVIGVRTKEDVERTRQDILGWERRIVRAVGTPEQYRALREDRRPERAVKTGGSA